MLKRCIFLLFIFLIWGCNGDGGGGDTDIVIPVSVEELRPQAIEEFVLATGTVSALMDVVLQSETNGYYRLLKNNKTGQTYSLGDYVKEGTSIIRLENPEYENTIKLESQELNLDISKREFEKQQSLYDKGGVTLRELKNAERTFIEAKYSYDNALIQLAKLNIVAPFDGIIVDIPYYTPGIKIGTNQTMVKLMNYSKLYLELNLPGKDFPRIKTEQPVRVTNYAVLVNAGLHHGLVGGTE